MKQKEYEIQILSMSNEGSSVKGMGQKPEITGQMTSLEELLESYKQAVGFAKKLWKAAAKGCKTDEEGGLFPHKF